MHPAHRQTPSLPPQQDQEYKVQIYVSERQSCALDARNSDWWSSDRAVGGLWLYHGSGDHAVLRRVRLWRHRQRCTNAVAVRLRQSQLRQRWL